jgi:hypothetical protein
MKLLALTLTLVLAACGLDSAGGEEGEGGATADSRCASGLRWTGGNAESSLMHPGADCIGCHSAGEGPRFIVAGTVHLQIDEPSDCYGVEGAVVTVTDANSQSMDLVTNAAGNFYLSARNNLRMPIFASIAFEGRVRAMSVAQTTGACASCHTETGASGAPGRILAP